MKVGFLLNESKDCGAFQAFRSIQTPVTDYGAINLCVADTQFNCQVFICLRHDLHAAVSHAGAW